MKQPKPPSSKSIDQTYFLAPPNPLLKEVYDGVREKAVRYKIDYDLTATESSIPKYQSGTQINIQLTHPNEVTPCLEVIVSLRENEIMPRAELEQCTKNPSHILYGIEVRYSTKDTLAKQAFQNMQAKLAKSGKVLHQRTTLPSGTLKPGEEAWYVLLEGDKQDRGTQEITTLPKPIPPI